MTALRLRAELAVDRFECADDDLLAFGEFKNGFLQRSHFVKVGEFSGLRRGGARGFLPHHQALRGFPIARQDQRRERGQKATDGCGRQPQFAARPDKPNELARRKRQRVEGVHGSSSRGAVDDLRGFGGARPAQRNVRTASRVLRARASRARPKHPLLEVSSPDGVFGVVIHVVGPVAGGLTACVDFSQHAGGAGRLSSVATYV